MTEMTFPASASEWIARLSEEPDNDRLRRDHDLWLDASPENRADWDETLRVWQMLDMTVPVHGGEWADNAQANLPQQDRVSSARMHSPTALSMAKQPNGAARQTRKMRTPRTGLWRRASYGLSAVAIAACILVAMVPSWITQFEADYATEIRETRVIALPDGSKLHLGPQSLVALDFAEKRTVSLLEGEAFFEVEPMPDRPFVVTANGVSTTVLGTAFNVRTGDDSVDIAVEHGHVRVNSTAMAEGQELLAGDMVNVNGDGMVMRQQIAPSLVGSWRHGQLIAKDQAFSEMVETIERYYDGWVVIADGELARKPLTGFYDLTDPVAALHAMADAQGGTVQQVSPWVLIISSK